MESWVGIAGCHLYRNGMGHGSTLFSVEYNAKRWGLSNGHCGTPVGSG